MTHVRKVKRDKVLTMVPVSLANPRLTIPINLRDTTIVMKPGRCNRISPLTLTGCYRIKATQHGSAVDHLLDVFFGLELLLDVEHSLFHDFSSLGVLVVHAHLVVELFS